MIRTIMFDLDGTLLPMDQNIYVKEYFEGLTGYFAQKGYEPKLFGDALFKSVVAAMQNRSELTNEGMFWKTFREIMGVDLREEMEELYHFYALVHPTMCRAVVQGRDSRKPVEMLKAKGYRVLLTTNPVFPVMATYQRMSWAGFVPSDFELVTTYETSFRCKPNPEYFLEVAERAGVKLEECLVVGNDTRDDMCAASVGAQVYLITDHIIDRDNSVEKYPHGTFRDFVEMVEQMPKL